MTLLKCFTNTFDSYMTENGYRRKGKLYYRLRGEILQGIVLRAIDHYDVCYTCFPYWSYQYRQPAYSLEWLSKGFWAEIGESIPGTCFRYNSDEENVRVMEEIRQLIEPR